MPSLGNAFLQRKCACGSHSHGQGQCSDCAKGNQVLQRKLSVGASNDPLEAEADRVATQVLSESGRGAIAATPVRVQRVPNRPHDEEAEAPSIVDEALSERGAPLAPALRYDMESRFGHDFSQVRVHTGAAATRSARAINAHAYTVRSDIVFGSGQFMPGTPALHDDGLESAGFAGSAEAPERRRPDSTVAGEPGAGGAAQEGHGDADGGNAVGRDRRKRRGRCGTCDPAACRNTDATAGVRRRYRGNGESRRGYWRRRGRE
jgi:hypothetical protein